ncbi:MAG: NADH-quinone oxidoreductase subunit NuoN [Proteobacteria bacterium]|nr:NADH-quinone oxidoreductase subunit NuoN [Pseudomonadota bacterium]
MIHELNILPATPEMFLAVAAMALLMLGVFRGERSTRMVTLLSLTALVLTALLLPIFNAGVEDSFAGQFVVDRFALFMKSLVILASAAGIVMSLSYIERIGIARFEYPILMLFATVGMMMMISANDLIALYLGLELQSLSLYVVAAFQRDSARSTEAGLKYFVLGAVASGMILYGSSLVYGFAGTTGFYGLADVFGRAAGAAPSLGVIVGMVFVIAGLSFKVSAVPFHMWTPDVYEGAPTSVTAFFSIAPKIAAVSLFIRVMVGPFGPLLDRWQGIIVLISIASMILGALAAINQANIKRLMAYSSIGHVGYALIGLAVGNESGIRGVLIYMAIYLFMNAGCFACILCMRQKGQMVEEIDSLAGLAKTNPMMALAMAVFMFSMAGLPPLAGFFGKLYVFLAAIDAGLYTLAVIGVVSSVVAAYYYLRIVKVMYFDEPSEVFDRPIGLEMTTLLAVTTLFVTFFFIYPAPLLSSAAAAAAALFGG